MRSPNNVSVKNRKRVAALVRGVYEGTESLEDAMRAWPAKAEFDAAYQAIEHWIVDGDIREKDERYARWQTQQIEAVIARLEQGQPLDERASGFLQPHPILKTRRERSPKRSEEGD